MGCKLSQMYFLKQSAVKSGKQRGLAWFCNDILGLWEVSYNSCVIDCALGEALLEKKNQRNFSGLGREVGGGEDKKMGCLTTRPSPEAILTQLRSVCVCVCTAFLCWQHSEKHSFHPCENTVSGNWCKLLQQKQALFCWYRLHLHKEI